MKAIKKFLALSLFVVTILTLSACSQSSDTKITNDLKNNKWNIVSTNGESYTGEFAESTVSFKSGVFSRGFKYNVKNGDIILKEDDEKISFKVKKSNEEYEFISKDKNTQKQYGDLTLSKVK